MKARLAAIDIDTAIEPDQPQLKPDKIWSIYVQEIEFHIDIIGYSSDYFPTLVQSHTQLRFYS